MKQTPEQKAVYWAKVREENLARRTKPSHEREVSIVPRQTHKEREVVIIPMILPPMRSAGRWRRFRGLLAGLRISDEWVGIQFEHPSDVRGSAVIVTTLYGEWPEEFRGITIERRADTNNKGLLWIRKRCNGKRQAFTALEDIREEYTRKEQELSSGAFNTWLTHTMQDYYHRYPHAPGYARFALLYGYRESD